MSAYSIEIQFPIKVDGSTSTVLNMQTSKDVLHEFKALKWRQYRSLQLQVTGAKTSFLVTSVDREKSIQLTLLPQVGTNDQIEFLFESDLVVITDKKDLFGLMTRKIKDNLYFERIELEHAKNCLELFVSNQIETLEDYWRQQAKQK